jgi:2-keto-4-pentenoate hydratase/2-oxohepta-3-ene-1,7-dioic acid hydratase in catechol pathway
LKIIRFLDDDKAKYGVVKGEEVLIVHDDIFADPAASKYGPRTVKLDEVKLLAPCQPGKVVAVGLNYADHARETNLPIPDEPVIFIKPSSAVIGSLEEIVYPSSSRQVDYEAELALIVRDTPRNVSPAEAATYILGYTCGNDVTARDLQRKDGQWTRSKSFDSFCPLGPWIITDLDTSDLAISCRVNGQVQQTGSTRDMIFNPAELLSFISRIMTLEAGDVIMTGTPAGIGPVQPGDVVEVEIAGIGVLRNPVVAGA